LSCSWYIRILTLIQNIRLLIRATLHYDRILAGRGHYTHNSWPLLFSFSLILLIIARYYYYHCHWLHYFSFSFSLLIFIDIFTLLIFHYCISLHFHTLHCIIDYYWRISLLKIAITPHSFQPATYWHYITIDIKYICEASSYCFAAIEYIDYITTFTHYYFDRHWLADTLTHWLAASHWGTLLLIFSLDIAIISLFSFLIHIRLHYIDTLPSHYWLFHCFQPHEARCISHSLHWFSFSFIFTFSICTFSLLLINYWYFIIDYID
jgi:hypothetical protein